MTLIGKTTTETQSVTCAISWPSSTTGTCALSNVNTVSRGTFLKESTAYKRRYITFRLMTS